MQENQEKQEISSEVSEAPVQAIKTENPEIVKKKRVMTEKALENLRKARLILKEKRAIAKANGTKLISRKKLNKTIKKCMRSHVLNHASGFICKYLSTLVSCCGKEKGNT